MSKIAGKGRNSRLRVNGSLALAVSVALVASAVTLMTHAASAGEEKLVSIYPAGAVPAHPAESDSESVELGVSFNVKVAGTVVGVKFYKSAANRGSHTGSLWTSTGTRLATATFSAESATGWQAVKFASSVSLKPGQTYVASYHTSTGHYAQKQRVFRNGATIGNQTVQATSGTYGYGGSAFPRSSWHEAAYFVDVLFTPTSTGGSSPTPTTSVMPTTSPSSASPTSTTPTTSATPTKTPTTSPTPTQSGFPTSANTGVPAGTALTTFTGSCNLAAGTVIDSKILNCPVEILGAGVKITRSQINGIIQSDHSDSGRGSASVSITDSYINGGQQEQFPSVSYDSVTLLRDEIVGGQHSVQCNSNCTITDSYLHAQYLPTSSSGHVNAFISNGGSGFTLRHNTLWCSVAQTPNDGGCSGDASIFGDFGPISNVVMDNNLFHATHGSFGVFGGNEPSKPFPVPTNVSITNNTFQRGTYPGSTGAFTCGYYGAITSDNYDAESGNHFDDGARVGR